MTSKERIIAAIEHRETDRVPFREEYWGSTIERFKREGMPAQAEVESYFGLDPWHMTSVDWSYQFPVRFLEETDEYKIELTRDGVKSKTFKHHASMCEWSDFSLTSRADWENLKSRQAWNETRVDLEQAKRANAAAKDQFRIYMPATCGFERYKYSMGVEGILVAIAEDPVWVKEMCDATAEMCINGLEYLLGHGLEFDCAFITEDNGFSNGPFFSPDTYREVIMPCQQRFADVCHARGLKVMLHTCGDNRALLPMYAEMGVDILNPLEAKAGMDLIEIKKQYGDVFTLWGGIDVRAISHADPAWLEKEIAEKVPFAKKNGGYIFGSDHSIPENVSLERYQFMLELGRKYGAY